VLKDLVKERLSCLYMYMSDTAHCTITAKTNISIMSLFHYSLYDSVILQEIMNSLQVLIDNEEAESGELEADWNFLPPKKIKDPSQSKPADWDDKPTIDDPEDKKPEDWDKPEHVPDPEATKPEDWDDEMDGEWEAPMIDNPDYKVRILRSICIRKSI